jgi:hypothetical protein
VWKNIRIGILLVILGLVALQQYFERAATHSWQNTLWVGVFPLNADGSALAQQYIQTLTAKDFADIEAFFIREGRRYGVTAAQPVHIELYPQGAQLPPELPAEAGIVARAWWSLRMRWYAAHASKFPGRAPSRVRIFVLYHDPATLDSVPDSHGLQKGLVGVVHAFADRAMSGSNNMVIAHELLHTAGASDKYELGSGEPLVPIGLGDREQVPRYPQERTEIMAGRRAVSAHDWEIPSSLRSVVVGPETALEIHWSKP